MCCSFSLYSMILSWLFINRVVLRLLGSYIIVRLGALRDILARPITWCVMLQQCGYMIKVLRTACRIRCWNNITVNKCTRANLLFIYAYYQSRQKPHLLSLARVLWCHSSSLTLASIILVDSLNQQWHFHLLFRVQHRSFSVKSYRLISLLRGRP